MLFRSLLAVVALAVNMAFGQSGFYGAATGHPKAGDPAPDLVFSHLLSAPQPSSWTEANLSDR